MKANKRKTELNETTQLFTEERRRQILAQIQQDGRATVAALSEQFGVTGATIRNDLSALADSGLILRTHGGAVPQTPGPGELSLALRRGRHTQEKALIGRLGASLIADGEAVFLDSSSTALAIAGELKAHRHLTVLTNSLAVAQELLDAPGVSVVMTGGRLRRDTASLVEPGDLAPIQGFNLQKGFFGAHGISLAEGLTDVSLEEAALKRRLLVLCRQVIAVLDGSKWGQVGLMTFAGLEQVDLVLSDDRAPAALVEEVQAAGPDVRLVT